MEKLKLIFLIIIFLLPNMAMAGINVANHHVEASGDTLWVYLHDCQTGLEEQMQDSITFAPEFLEGVKLANEQKAYFTVLVTNNAWGHKLLQELAEDPELKGLDFKELRRYFDSMPQGGRKTLGDEILRWAGLKEHALVNRKYLPDQEECYVMIFPVRNSGSAPGVLAHLSGNLDSSASLPLGTLKSGGTFRKPSTTSSGKCMEPSRHFDLIVKSLTVEEDVSPSTGRVPFDVRAKFDVEGGQKPHKIELKLDGKLISTTSTDTMCFVKKAGDHLLELSVVDAIGDSVYVKRDLYGLKGNWSWGLHLGAASTRKTVAPAGMASAYYREQVMLRFAGCHSFFSRHDRDYFGSQQPTFDWSWQATAGFKLVDRFWLVGGFHGEETVLDGDVESGTNIRWYDSAQLGLDWIHKNMIIHVAGTYGNEWIIDQGMTTDWGFRFGVVIGHTWRQ